MNKLTDLTHPYHDLGGSPRWLRGNLHAHTTCSDGALSPQEVIDVYATAGCQFLMVSDHDILSTPEWLGSLDAKGMILIPGNEVTRNGGHILHVHASGLVAPDADRQVVLDAIRDDADSFSILGHPNWENTFNHIPTEEMERLQNWQGVEIFNGSVGRAPGSAYALDKWDIVLSQGRRVWGFANDDSHLLCDCNLGWNMVATDDLSPKGISEALRQGRFYASTGVEIETLGVKGRQIHLKTKNAERIVVVTDHGKRLHHVDADEIRFEAPESGTYFRLECWGSGEKFAWTQPFFNQPA